MSDNDFGSRGPRYSLDARERLHILAPHRGGQGDIPLVETRHCFQGLQDNNYGNALFVEPDQKQLLLRAHGSDDMPHTISLSAGFQLDDKVTEVAPGFDVAPFLVLKFGVGGANMEFELDLLSGMILNVCATSFDLEVHNPTNYNLTGRPGTTIFAQATFGVGGAARAGSNPARRTRVLPPLGIGASSQPIQVPQGAVAINVYSTVPTDIPNLQVDQFTTENGILLAASQNPAFDTGNGAVSLVAGARALRITNNGGAVTGTLRVLFTIAF